MSTVYICAGCGVEQERYEDDEPYVEIPSVLCSRCINDEAAFDRALEAHEMELEPLIELGRGMIFPDSWANGPPEGPDTVSCPECGEDRWAVDEPCEHCNHEWEGTDE